MTLFINSCPRKDSRTKKIADALLNKLGTFVEVDLNQLELKPIDDERLNKRNELLQGGHLDAEEFALARQFALADTIVIAAPLWDLSFPSILKLYIENIYISGIVSKYGPDGRPVGLCNAKTLYFVSTSGGPFDARYGYEYLSSLCKEYFGIPETKLIVAENLDIIGNDADEICKLTIENLRRVLFD